LKSAPAFLLACVLSIFAPGRAEAACTLDGDGDGVCDVEDNCPEDSNAPQSDEDGDGRGDACDSCPSQAGAAEDACLGVGSWTRRADNDVARSEIGATEAGGLVYVIGGQQNAARKSVEMYDPATDRWSEGPDLPVGRHHVQPVTVDGKIYVIGGLVEFPGPSLDDVLVLDPAQPSLGWTIRKPMPTPRGAHGCAAWDTKIYCAGGLSSTANDHAIDVLEAYDTITDEWTTLAPMPRVRDHFRAEIIDGKFYAVSGRDTTITATFSFADVYDIAADRWSSVAAMPTARGGYASAVLEGRLLIIGGEGDGPPNGVFPNVEEYDPRRNVWRRLADLPQPRHGIGTGVSRALDGVKPRVYVAAGAPQLGGAQSTFHHSFEYDAVVQHCTFALCDDHDPCTADRCDGADCDHAALPGGDVDGDGSVDATDALLTLRASVGASSCEPCVCDADRSGDVTAADALIVLRVAVGLDSRLACACAAVAVPAPLP
jgi:Kelch motif/Dockerin type I domain